MDFSKRITYIRALIFPFKVSAPENIILIISQAISLAIVPVRVLVTAYFINEALYTVSEGLDTWWIIPPLLALAALSVYNYILMPLTELINTRRRIKIHLALRVPLLEKRARLEYMYIENPETMNLLNRVWDDPESKFSGVLDNLTKFIVTVGSIISYAIILFSYVPLVGGILIIMSIPVFVVAAKTGKTYYQVVRDTSLDQRYQGQIAFVMQSRQYAAERNLFGWGDYMNDKFHGFYTSAMKRRWKMRIKMIIHRQITTILMGIFSASGLFLMIGFVADGALSVGMFIALQIALFSIINIIGVNLPDYFQEFIMQREYP